MSYSDLSDRYSIVTQHMKKGSSAVGNITQFFKNYKKTIENYSVSIQKLCEGLNLEIQDDSSTLEIAMNGLYQSLKKSLYEHVTFSKNMQLEIIEPLELFLDHYNDTINPHILNGENISKHLSKAKEQMVKNRHKYYKLSGAAEKNEKNLGSADDKGHKTLLHMRSIANKSSEDYMKSIETVNKFIEEFDKTIPELMTSLQQNEESRIHFIKSIVEKFIKSLCKSKLTEKDNFDQVLGLLNNVNSEIDIKVFVDRYKGKYKGGVKEEYVSYQKWRDKRKELNEIDTKDPEENYEEVLEKCINYLMSGEETDSDSSLSEYEIEEPDYLRVSGAFKSSNYRIYFLELLEAKKHKCALNPTRMSFLVSSLKSLLTAIIIDEDKDPNVFCKVLALLHCFYTDSPEHKRKYLSQLLSSHTIWCEKIRWVEAIEHMTNMKIFNDKESIRRFAQQPKKKGFIGALKNIATKIPGVFQKENVTDESEKTAAFIIITQFSFYMSHLSLPLDVCNSIILHCCQRANLDSNRTCTLLAELEANQRASLQTLNSAKHSLRTREKERKQFSSYLPIGLSLDFLSPSETVVLLTISKKWKYHLHEPILKKCLLYWDLPSKNKNALRKCTWLKLLKGHIKDIDYPAFLNKVKTVNNIEIEEVVSLDVSRSYQGSTLVPSESLKNILVVYAFYHNEVGYCQGMNYVAGTIFSFFQDEALSLKIMIAIIDKFKMTDLFTDNLPKLKQFFYQLDRLISMELPELHELFKQINITAGHFCAPWFITLFASHLQNKPNILGKLWDLFLFDGWKVMFKAGIAILQKLSKDLINARFEDIMFALSSIQTNNPIIDVFDESFIKAVHNVNITNALLKELEMEYEHLKKRAEKHTKG
ncbi:hypothetical protein SteCoe_20125 [Stentor coeruleus]|uniref:Rab-GAP TBC domain-containing protein n=1 Tax=Stentor coeruleus TaxID=5963 RepID=A0A1R2BSQ2_9CILI|nr:hypothetical protein SteCoe_20125 [Stentor coeruleus]